MDKELVERRARCAELQAKYPEGLLPPCHIDHDAMCRDHTLAVLRGLREQAVSSEDNNGEYTYITIELIDEAIRNEEKA